MKFDNKTKRRCFTFDTYCIGEDFEIIKEELNHDLIKWCHILHDKDNKKEHIHIMLDYGQPTTLKFMRDCYKHLAANECVFPVLEPYQYYKYLYHDQSIESSHGKYVYDPSEIILHNGFDPDDLKTISESEKLVMMDSIINIANVNKIYEYAGLLEYLSVNDRKIYAFAINNTILINGFMNSHRNRNKSVDKSNNN